MQKNYKENHLKPYAVKSVNSKGRIYKETENSIRSPYQRDRDRIIHSSSFRRLKHKTQVFVNTEGDHYRTRLTHSMEVSQIARTLARSLGLNEDLSETLSLAHDLGHAPFGHAGEEVLRDCMERYGGFDHNIQTLRIVTWLENKYYNFFGLNLTIETLDGLLKHNGTIKDVTPYKNLSDVIPKVDIISIHTSNTEEILTTKEFNLMKDGIYILNSSRGEVINEESLEIFLKNGKVAGAWLDVFWKEPYKGNLINYNNVILTPHIGSYSYEGRVIMETTAVENLINHFNKVINNG